MKLHSYLQRFRTSLVMARLILFFDFLGLSIWAICFNLIASNAWWWDVENIIMVWGCACIYFLMTILGTGIIPYVLDLMGKSPLIKRDLVFINRRDAKMLIDGFWGLLVALLLLVLASLIISVMLHAPDKAAWFGKFISSPIFVLPNILTIGILVYIAWKSGQFLKSESEPA